MASPRRVPRSLLVISLAGAAMLSVLTAGTGNADPRPSLREVEQRVNALNSKVDVAVEQFAQSRIALAAANRRAAVALARVRAAQAELDAIKKAMGSVAAAAYRSGGSDQLVQLVNTSTPQTFLDRAASLNRIASGQRAQLAAAATARHRLAVVRAQAAQEQATSAAVSKAMAAQKAQIESALAEQQRLLSSLKAAERARLNAMRQAAAAAARASRSRTLAVPTYNGPASGRAAVAVREAYNQLGKPYQWGGSGPSSFDCSGLTAWVWGHAGVSLSHSAAAQYNEGQHVSLANIQPGDLTFYGSPIHHVGIYIGNGNMISAPHSGDVVKIQPAFRSDYVGASRP
ncbi:MAG: hypothetical protein JWM02_1242 [Frankiales bacterium]|nr:hypothetical protein [Frankiales bacterium]